jgi:hypothetical protein
MLNFVIVPNPYCSQLNWDNMILRISDDNEHNHLPDLAKIGSMQIRNESKETAERSAESLGQIFENFATAALALPQHAGIIQHLAVLINLIYN